MPQDAAPDLDVTGPVLCIDHDNAARAYQDMVQIGFGASGPMHVMKGHPALGLQRFQDRRNTGFTRGTRGPRPFRPFCVLELPSQFGRSFRRHPRLLSRAAACPHFRPQARWCLLTALEAYFRRKVARGEQAGLLRGERPGVVPQRAVIGKNTRGSCKSAG